MDKIKVIGEGTFGCVHKPSLKCDTSVISSYNNKVSKIMSSNQAKNELREYSLISKIDKKKEFHLGMPKKCGVDSSPDAITAVRKCDNITKRYMNNRVSKSSLKPMALLIMNFGGENLVQYSKSYKKVKNSSRSVNRINRFWIEAHRLFRGLAVFHNNKIVHHDVKPQNIVYHAKENRVNYIDFGHMINIDKQIEVSRESNSWMYNYAFWNYPFEIQFLNRIKYEEFVAKSEDKRKAYYKWFLEELQNNEFSEFTDTFNTFIAYMSYGKSASDILEIKNRYLTDYYTMIKKMSLEEYDIFLKKSVETVDVYGLGMALQYVLSYSAHLIPPEMTKKLEHCFYKMTCANLFERYTCFEAIYDFENILKDFFPNMGFENKERVSLKRRTKRAPQNRIGRHRATKRVVHS